MEVNLPRGVIPGDITRYWFQPEQETESNPKAQILHCGGSSICIQYRSQKNPNGGTAEGEGLMPEILLAEDNPADVYLIREALREHSVDCTMRVASDGEEVLRIVSGEVAQHLRLIILDLNLPRRDGIEVLRGLKETAELTHIAVVILTSSDSPR